MDSQKDSTNIYNVDARERVFHYKIVRKHSFKKNKDHLSLNFYLKREHHSGLTYIHLRFYFTINLNGEKCTSDGSNSFLVLTDIIEKRASLTVGIFLF